MIKTLLLSCLVSCCLAVDNTVLIRSHIQDNAAAQTAPAAVQTAPEGSMPSALKEDELDLKQLRIAKNVDEWRLWTEPIRQRYAQEEDLNFERAVVIQADGKLPAEAFVKKSAVRLKTKKAGSFLKKAREASGRLHAELAHRKYARRAYLDLLSRQDPSVVPTYGLIGWFANTGLKIGGKWPNSAKNGSSLCPSLSGKPPLDAGTFKVYDGTCVPLPEATFSTAASVIKTDSIGAYLSGTATDYVSFWTADAGVVQVGAMPLTICSVTKYMDTAAKGHVLCGAPAATAIGGGSFVHGHFWLNNTLNATYGKLSKYSTHVAGYAKYGKTIVSNLVFPANTGWLAMCGTVDGVSSSNIWVNTPNTMVATGSVGCANAYTKFQVGQVACGGTAAAPTAFDGFGINLQKATTLPVPLQSVCLSSNFAVMEVLIWNRVLTTMEINPIMNYFKALQEPFTTTTINNRTNFTKAGSIHRAANWYLLIALSAASTWIL